MASKREHKRSVFPLEQAKLMFVIMIINPMSLVGTLEGLLRRYFKLKVAKATPPMLWSYSISEWCSKVKKEKKKLRKTADNLLLIVFNYLYPKSMKNSSKVFLKDHRSRLLALVEIFPFYFYWRKTVLYVFGWLAVVQLFKSLPRS